MCIKKEGSFYRVGSKLYTKGKFFNTVMIVVAVLIFLALFVWAGIDMMVDSSNVNKILASDDPTANLILALDNDPTWARARYALNKIGDPLLLTLAPACEGQAVGGTVYQDSRPGPHPLALLLPDGKSHERTYYYLKQWGPDSRQAEDVQLVVCVIEGERRIEACKYDQGKVRTRIQNMITLNVIEAATGRTYAHQDFEGPLPGKCPGSLSSSASSHNEIRGGEVDTSKFSEFLQELFE